MSLVDTGRREAEAMADVLAERWPALLVSSDLARARETAAFLEKATGLTALEDARLREFGLWLCRRIQKPSAELTGTASSAVTLPAPSRLVEMDRGELLALAQSVTLSDRAACRDGMRDREHWARMLGGIALSYARDGDLVVVAALLRVSAHVELQGPWLTEALGHLLDQQHSDGSFGLLAPELALSGDPGGQPRVTCRLTVEVLWALAEVAAARRRTRPPADDGRRAITRARIDRDS